MWIFRLNELFLSSVAQHSSQEKLGWKAWWRINGWFARLILDTADMDKCSAAEDLGTVLPELIRIASGNVFDMKLLGVELQVQKKKALSGDMAGAVEKSLQGKVTMEMLAALKRKWAERLDEGFEGLP